MKVLLFTFILVFSSLLLQAQNADFEVKVVSKKYQNVKGKLQKVSAEGIAIVDYKGNYLIFRATEIVKLKIRKRGLTVGEGAGAGATTGLVIGAGIWSLDDEGQSSGEMLKLTGVLTASGAVLGTITGVIAEIINSKLILNIEGDEEKFIKNYKKLEKYINLVNTERF